MAKKLYAVILAAGAGSRLDAETPKQFGKLAGRSLIEYAFATFDQHESITDIVLVVPEKMTAEQLLVVKRLQFEASKFTIVVQGGPTRNRSTLKALDIIIDNEAHVLIHDAARPLIQPDIISRCVDALQHYDAIDVVIDCADTIVEVSEDECLKAIPKRAALRQGQTPQGFKVGLLKEAYRKASAVEDLDNSDDCSIVLKYLPSVAIKCVRGSENNLKITRAIDLVTADRLFQLRSASHLEVAYKSGKSADIRSRVIVVFGSSSGIGYEIMSMAHTAGAIMRGFSLSDGGVDIRDEHAVGRSLEKVNDECGRVDVVINTAGILHRGLLLEQSMDSIRDTINTNLLGAFIISQQAMPYLRQTQGQLVFFTSSSYTRGRPTYAVYSAAKAGLVNMVQALSEEYAPYNVRVNCINPERTATRMRQRAFSDEDPEEMLQAVDVARVALSVINTCMTGQVIDVTRDLKKKPSVQQEELKRIPANEVATSPSGDTGLVSNHFSVQTKSHDLFV